jgi:hypothetical protein
MRQHPRGWTSYLITLAGCERRGGSGAYCESANERVLLMKRGTSSMSRNDAMRL